MRQQCTCGSAFTYDTFDERQDEVARIYYAAMPNGTHQVSGIRAAAFNEEGDHCAVCTNRFNEKRRRGMDYKLDHAKMKSKLEAEGWTVDAIAEPVNQDVTEFRVSKEGLETKVTVSGLEVFQKRGQILDDLLKNLKAAHEKEKNK